MDFLRKAAAATGLRGRTESSESCGTAPNAYCAAPEMIHASLSANKSVPHVSAVDGRGHAWSAEPSTVFELRIGPDYNRNKQKAPSGPPMFELLGMDMFSSPAKIDNIASKLSMPPEWTSGELGVTNSANIMPLFIVNVQVPRELGTNLLSIFDNITDGPGFSIVYYYRLSRENAEALQDLSSASAGLRTFEEFCKYAPCPELDTGGEDVWESRFKVVTFCTNMDEFGYPGFITQYNGKPVLIRTTGTVYKGENYIEMDINVHNFGTIARKGMEIMFNNFSKMVIEVGFCIEGRQDSELPEVLIGCVQMDRPDYEKAIPWPGPV